MINKLQKALTFFAFAILLFASLACFLPPPPPRNGPIGRPPIGDDAVSPLSVPDRQFPEQHVTVNAVAFDPTGHWMATARADGKIALWDFLPGHLLWQSEDGSAEVFSLSFRGDGKVLASGGKDGVIKFWDVAAGHLSNSISAKQGEIRSVVFSPDDRLLASAGSDHSVKLWNPQSRELVRALNGHTGGVNSVAFSANGTILASASSDQSVRLWNPASGDLLHVLAGHSQPVDALAFRPDGLQLASGSAIAAPLSHHGGYQMWDIESGTEVATESQKFAVSALAFRPNGRELAIAYRGDGGYWCINLIALDQDRLLRRYVAHRKGISAIAFTPDGTWLVSAGHDGAIRCWH